jgi:hemerythrin
MTLVWNPDLLLGNTQIDDQHRRIFQILDKLITAIAERKGHEEVGGVLTAASVFVAAHFQMEEALMLQYQYPDLAVHRKSHEALRLQVEYLVDQFHKTGPEPLELAKFMEWWLQDHIERQDRPMAHYLKALEPAAG